MNPAVTALADVNREAATLGSVVLAEDHEPTRAMWRLVVEAAGYEVIGEAADGLDLLSQVLSYSPDVVIVDDQMPRIKGAAAARIVRAIAPRTKIVICSASELSALPEIDAIVSKEDASYLPLFLDRVMR